MLLYNELNYKLKNNQVILSSYRITQVDLCVNASKGFHVIQNDT